MTRWPPFLCAGLHVIAMIVMLLLRGGMETEPDEIARARFITEHEVLWRIGWIVWMGAALSLAIFYDWWRHRVPNRFVATLAVFIAVVGMFCDWTGECQFLWLIDWADSKLHGGFATLFDSTQRTGTLLTAGAANGLYTIGGILLTLVTRNLPRRILALMWVTWLAGIAMTVSALLGSVQGLVVSSAILFPAFVTWVAWMGWKWKPAG